MYWPTLHRALCAQMLPGSDRPLPASLPEAVAGGGRSTAHIGPAAVSKLKVLDLFSGIGGFSLGLERTGGFETVAFCEIEDFPRRVLAKHWPDVPCYQDVRELTAAKLAADGIAVSGMCGGFPCQDASFAQTQWGERPGIDGERTGLWSEYRRLIGELRPDFAVMENVPGLFSAGFGVVLGDLAALGYDAEWRCIPASLSGLPHQRDRVWLLCYPSGSGLARPVEGQSILERAEAAFAEHGDAVAGPWRTLDGRLDSVRDCHGLSVTMDRRRVKALGNAVVPQIPELIGRAILQALAQPLHDPRHDLAQRDRSKMAGNGLLSHEVTNG